MELDCYPPGRLIIGTVEVRFLETPQRCSMLKADCCGAGCSFAEDKEDEPCWGEINVVDECWTPRELIAIGSMHVKDMKICA